MSLTVVQIPVEGLDSNFSYLIVNEQEQSAALVDPSGDIERVYEALLGRGLTLTAIYITHTHFDHIDRLQEVIGKYPIPVYVHERGAGKIEVPSELLRTVADGDTIELGGAKSNVLYTPGHIDDAICLYIGAKQTVDGIPKLITGDTLFVEGCGRTTQAQVGDLYESLQRLKTLPNETEVFPGHDYGSQPVSTIGREKETNKYLGAKDFDAFIAERLG